jgi:hypothetical protein
VIVISIRKYRILLRIDYGSSRDLYHVVSQKISLEKFRHQQPREERKLVFKVQSLLYYYLSFRSILFQNNESVIMSISSQAAARCCRQVVRSSASSSQAPFLRISTSSSSTFQQRRRTAVPSARRWQSTDAAAAPANPKIVQIVDQISQLTLLETADLVASLKVGFFLLGIDA